MKGKTLALAAAVLIVSSAKAQWQPFGTSLPSFVIGFEADSSTLYGYGQPSQWVYEWTGTDWQQTLTQLPSSDGIHKLKTIDTALYALTYAAGTTNHVLAWQGNSWQALGGSFVNAGSADPPTLYDIIKYNNELYVTGDFNRVDNDTISGIAKWNGTSWVNVGQGLVSGMPPYTTLLYPHQLLLFNGELVVVGNFLNAGGITANGIAAWNGSQWNNFGSGFNKIVYGAEVYNSELYAGGEFTLSGTNTLACIAKWNGSDWVNPGFGFSYYNMGGLHPFIHTLKDIAGALYIAGGFNRETDAGGAHLSSGIVSFDGTSVDTLYGGVNSDAEAIFPYQGGILVGGGFNLAGSTAVNNVALLQTANDVNESVPTDALHVYPNPAQHIFTVYFKNDNFEVEISDLSGRKIFAGKNFQEFARIDCSGFSNGVYFLKVMNERNNFTKKVFVIH